MNNDDKIRTGLWLRKAEGRPTSYSGNVTIGGVEYFLDLYKNDKKQDGDKQPDLHLVHKPKGSKTRYSAPSPAAPSRPLATDDFDDSIPDFL